MDTQNKCCGNCRFFGSEDLGGYGECQLSSTIRYCGDSCISYRPLFESWTEITPDNVEEIKSIERNRVIICASNSIGYMYPSTLLNLACSLESIADYGGYYYYVLPELKIE
jgi:hypothetical protein